MGKLFEVGQEKQISWINGYPAATAVTSSPGSLPVGVFVKSEGDYCSRGHPVDAVGGEVEPGAQDGPFVVLSWLIG